jgi:Arc/MetJ family transcription regulator
MRTTLNIDDDLLAEAQRLTGEKEKTTLVRLGLRALIEREAAWRLARLGASMPPENRAAKSVIVSHGAS